MSIATLHDGRPSDDDRSPRRGVVCSARPPDGGNGGNCRGVERHLMIPLVIVQIVESSPMIDEFAIYI